MARFLVTRAMPEAEETAAQIIASGHEAIVAPLRRVEAVLAPVPERPEALIATSANAFRYGTPIPADWHDLPVYCVGERTAEAARELEFVRRLHAADAHSLVQMTSVPPVPRLRQVYLTGEPRRPELERDAERTGISLTLWPRYRMVEMGELPANAKAALQANTCDAVLHFSAESAATLIRLAKIAGLVSTLAQPFHICLSEAIAERVRASLPSARVIVSEQKDATSLLEAAISAFA